MAASVEAVTAAQAQDPDTPRTLSHAHGPAPANPGMSPWLRLYIYCKTYASRTKSPSG